jgi:CheY-like chemotaxis protein
VADVSARILIAEDEPHIVESLSFILTRAGCAVSAVYDGEAVIQAMQGQPPPDVLILDVMLPKRNGFEVLKWVKSQPGLKNLSVMVLTAKGQQQDRETAEGLGVDAFITKPFANRDIVDCVKRLVSA